MGFASPRGRNVNLGEGWLRPINISAEPDGSFQRIDRWLVMKREHPVA